MTVRSIEALPTPGADGSSPLPLIIPYLVGAESENAGSDGFAAWLRDEYVQLDTRGRTRVLLILSDTPIDTVTTASRDLANEEALSPTGLCKLAARGAAAERLIRQAVETAEENRVLPSVPQTAGAAVLLARCNDVIAAGAALHQLGCYLPDRHQDAADPARLKRNIDWRMRLEEWTAPDKDLRAEMGRWARDPEHPALQVVLAARDAYGGLDWSKIPLDQLPERRPSRTPLGIARPLRIDGGRAVVTSSSTAVVWLPGGGTFSVRLAGEPGSAARSRVEWHNGTVSSCHVDGEQRLVHVTVEPGATWAFGVVHAPGGDQLPVAVYTGNGEWFPVEKNLQIESASAAFRYEGVPAVLAVRSGGTPVGACDLEEPGPEGSWIAQCSLYTDRHPIPLYSENADVPGEANDEWPADMPEDENTGRAGGQAENEEEFEDEGSDDELDGALGTSVSLPAQPSVAHAALHAAKAAGTAAVGATGYGVGRLKVGTDHYPLASQRLTPALEGLALESAILGHPEWLAYSIDSVSADGSVALSAARLERLDTSALPAEAYRNFLTARHAFFEALRGQGSVHAVVAGDHRESAEAYTAAFAAILNQLPRDSQIQPEHSRLALCDAVFGATPDEILLAPTNPVTVAFALAMSDTLEEWRPRASEVLADDLRAVTQRHLMPVLAVDRSWYECSTLAPLLWRRYKAAPAGNVQPDPDHRHISRRLEHFLTVYPDYRHPGQRISVTFVEPGDGRQVHQALREFFRGQLAPQEPLALKPDLDVVLVSDKTVQRPGLESLLANGSELDTCIRTRVRITLVKPDEADGFTHLTFVMRSNLQRTPTQVDMNDRAPSTWARGIATSPTRLAHPGTNESSFSWGTFATPVTVPDQPTSAEVLLNLMQRGLELVGGMSGGLMRPGVTSMPTTRVERDFMAAVYDRSVWVVHLDQLLGLEAFNGHVGSSSAKYLVHHEEPDPGAPGLDAITATKRTEPYRQAVARALTGIGEPPGAALDEFLRLLNGASGRWSLDLLRASAANVAERVGTIAAVALLDSGDRTLGLLADGGVRTAGLLVPLDELFAALPRRGLPRPPAPACDDLLQVWLPLGSADHLRISARLIEVKYRSAGVPGLDDARTQLERTVQWLERIFNTGGPGRPYRARDLSDLLRSATARANAFGLGEHIPASEVESALRALYDGDFSLDLSYTMGDSPRRGALISVEGQNTSATWQGALPGAGLPFDYFRLGRPAVAALARGHGISVPDDWTRPSWPSSYPPPPREKKGPQQPPAPPSGPELPAPIEDGPASHTGPNISDEADGPAKEAPPEPTQQISNLSGTPRFTSDSTVEEEIARVAGEMDAAAAKYGLAVEPFRPDLAQAGPGVIRLRTRLLGKQTLAALQGRALDLGREAGVAEGVLIDQEPYYVTLDVPRSKPETVRYVDYEHALDAPSQPGALPFLVGVAPDGEVRVADLARLPHLLVAGATGSGKSVLLQALLCSLIRVRAPRDLSLLIIDPKHVDFEPFQCLPHLLNKRIITDPHEAVEILTSTLEEELQKRRAILRDAEVFNALDFYAAGGQSQDLQQMVVLVDEFADLADSLPRAARQQFLQNIKRFAQMARALGIYLVLATQRPSVQVITGDIKANLTARVALKVQAAQDSMTILGRAGAEALRGRGDLLFDAGGLTERLQGFYCQPSDVSASVRRWTADSR
ncbi:FtsK/SpoIIIE domain-containing protein [Streptomyces sp. NBC_00322]|uniref:FtsK/SpoIIIE domain-containing protein n=1 Tax=Streptomyces sp. NBC_00322 TaxID=2975712 RepID=UPI002E2939B3|nr:FtsK/SpoIIIE domain-containing protein [Streptomyces sp. NBC_00322]